MSTLSLNDIVNVIVNVSPLAAVRSGFNLGLIIGKSTVISAADRVKVYSSLTAMIDDGWDGSEAEYIAAQRYFAQNPKPSKIAIGRWDGTGEETAVQAVTACRIANSEWYACMVCGALKADILAVAAYIEAVVPSSTFFYTTADADVKAGTAGNVALTVKASKYRRTIGQFSSDADAIAAILGYAMGANTGLANSAYTLAYKAEVGVTPEALTDTQVLAIKNANCNVYVNRGASYNLFEQGVMADGTPFDEVINLDVLADDIQKSVMDVLVSFPKVPQTEDGVGILISAVNGPCAKARTKGFLAPGIWNAPSILNLNTGDTLSNGYMVIAETVASQTQADRDARKSPPIYVPIKLAGAIEHVVINVLVNR